MPYTNVWSNVIPSGATQARQIDDHIRQVRLDVFERMNALVTDWTADPVVIKPEFLGGVTGKKLIIPAFKGICDTSAPLDVLFSNGGIQMTGVFVIPIELPIGVTITKVEFLLDKRSNSSIGWALYRKEFAAGVGVLIETVAHAGVGDVISATLDGLEEEVVDGFYYFIQTSGSFAAYDLYAIRVTYNTPNSSNTI